MKNTRVYIVDDDHAIRKALVLLLHSVGLKGEAFASAEKFFESYDPAVPACLILDVRLPGANGLVVQRQLRQRGIDLPVIVISGHADVPMAVQAVRDGAIDFLEKPFRDQDLLDRVFQALERDKQARRVAQQRAAMADRFATLTTRERLVLDLVVAGKANKEMAHELSITPKAVESRRSKIMAKTKARSIADLVRMSFETDAKAGFPSI